MKHTLLSISLIFGATAASADYFSKKQAFEIIENGKIMHSAIVKQSDASDLYYLKRYSVIYKGQPYDCTVDKGEQGHYAVCTKDAVGD